MTACITCVFSILFIPSLILAGETQANSSGLRDNNQAVSHRNRTNTGLKKPLIHPDSQEFENLDPNFLVNRSYEIRKSRSKKKRQTAHGTKTPHQKHHRSSNKHNKLKTNLHHNENSDVKIYETFEEIHEHINEPDEHDAQFDLSNRSEQEHEHVYEHEHEHDKSSGKGQSTQEEKENKDVKIKVKHHHHHHHHNHIKEVVKSVPKPYPVEKIVHIPIEKIVEKIVHVPKFVNVTVEKIIHVPVEKIVEKIIRVPKPIHIPKPYMVEKIMEKIIHVPKPYPVLKTVPYPVEIKVPVPYEKKIPVPYKVEIERKVPVYINAQEPYKYEHTYSSPYTEKHMPKFASETEETSHYPIYYSEKHNFNNPNPFRQGYIEPTENYSFNKPIPFKHTETPRTTEYHTNIEPAENYNVYKPNQFKQTEIPRKLEYQTITQPSENYHFNKPIPFKPTVLPRKTEYQPTENYNFNKPIPFKQTELPRKLEFQQVENYNANQPIPIKQTELPRKTEYQTNNEQTDQFTNIETSKVNSPLEPSAADSTFIPVKLLDPKSQFIVVTNNETTFDFNPIYGNKLHELPISFPIEFIQMQPMPFHGPLTLESSIPKSSFNST